MADSVVGRLIYKITGDVSDIKRSLTNTEKQIKKFTKFVQSAAGLFGAAAAFKSLVNVAKDLVNAALESEQAQAKLSAAMQISGQTAAGQVKQLTGLARALSLVTTYTDDETIGAMTTLTEVGGVSAKGMRELIPLVQDLATGLDMDLGTAADLVAKTIAGNAGALSRYGIKIKETKDPVERFSEVVKTLTERFGGMSEAMAKSAGGGLKQIRQEFDELKEAVGTRLLQAFQGTISALSSRVKADVILSTDVKDIGSPEEAVAYIKTLREETARLNEDLAIYRKQAEGLAGKMVGAGLIVSARTKRIAELQNKIEGLNRFLVQWKDVEADLPPVLTNTTQATEAQAEAAKKLMEERRKEAQQVADAGEKARAEEWNDIIESQEAQRDFLRAQAEEKKRIDDEVTEQFRKNLDEQIDACADAARERERIEQEAAEQIAQIREASWSFASDLLSSLSDLQRANLDRQLIELEAEQQRELEAFEGTEEERAALVKDFEKEKAELEYEAAMNSWKMQLAAAIVSGVRAVISSYQTLGWPLGLVPAGMQAAINTIQLAAIRAAKPVPNFAEGADFTVPAGYPNDSYRMNVESGEHVTVTPAGAGGEPFHIVVNLDGRPIIDTVARASRDRRLLINARSVV